MTNQDIKLDTIEEAVEEFRKGNFVIVVDDEDRENEETSSWLPRK